MATSGEASGGDDVERLEALEEAGEDHWVSSEVQGELRRGLPCRPRLWADKADELELVSIRRRCTGNDRLLVDEDGDLDPPRTKKPRRSRSKSSEGRRKRVATELDDLGENDCLQLWVRPRTSWRVAGAQIWRAALLLAEFIAAKPEMFTDATVLELGCGVGLASIAASRTARRVFATDGDVQALALAQKNVAQNCRRSGSQETVVVSSASATAIGRACTPQLRVLNWAASALPWRVLVPDARAAASTPTAFAWTQEDAGALAQLRVVIASDVLYDGDTARVFMAALRRVLLISTDNVTTVVAVERRPVFAASTMSIVSLGYDTFHAQLCLHRGAHEVVAVGPNRVKCRECSSSALGTNHQQNGGCLARFTAREYPVSDVPHVLDYDRPSTLELWIIDAVVVE